MSDQYPFETFMRRERRRERWEVIGMGVGWLVGMALLCVLLVLVPMPVPVAFLCGLVVGNLAPIVGFVVADWLSA